jgi:hypothetical protein
MAGKTDMARAYYLFSSPIVGRFIWSPRASLLLYLKCPNRDPRVRYAAKETAKLPLVNM